MRESWEHRVLFILGLSDLDAGGKVLMLFFFLYGISKKEDRTWPEIWPAGAYLKCYCEAFLDELQEAIKAYLILLSKYTKSNPSHKPVVLPWQI